jgi:asparagine synthase (glutamine-hydrolysing)
LRKILERQGHQFVTDHSDTEVLIHGYRQWGKALPDKLNGMWAFAIYDRDRKALFLSRDRLGKKPLYYTYQSNCFVFASELTSLMLHPCVDRSLSEKGLQKYFAYGYIPSPNSILRNCYKLPGGHNLFVQVDGLQHRIQKYWDFTLEPFDSTPKNPEKIWGETLLELLENAVKRRMAADVPVGIFLSGGIDSSTIAAIAMKNALENPVQTFSIGFKEASFNETHYSQIVSKHIGSKHHVEVLSVDRAKSLMHPIACKIDEPMGDASMVPTFLLSETTRKKVTVALGGDGADELFAGYDPFLALHLAKFYHKCVPKPIHKAIRMTAAKLSVSHRNMSLDFKLKRFLRGLEYPEVLWNATWLGPIAPKEIEQLFNVPVDLEALYSEAIEQWDACKDLGPVDKTIQFYTKLYLQDDILCKVDRSSMMNSLEVRSPFLDIELIDFVRKIPSRFKFRNGTTKYILKKAVSNVLPDEIVNRPKKGFGMPIGKWFKQNRFKIDVKPLDTLFSKPYIQTLEKEHKQNIADHRNVLWNLWLLSTWINTRSSINESADDKL